MIRFINKFDKRTVTDYLRYKIEATKHFYASFEYLLTTLPKNELKDLNECNWYETKNYDYCLIVDNDISFIIRQFRHHFTIFIKRETVHKIRDYDHLNTVKQKYGIITFFVDTDKMEEREEYNDDNFCELNKALPNMLALLREKANEEGDKMHLLSNSYALPVEEYVEIKDILIGEEIYNVEDYIFALEEMFRLHFEIFCQTEMITKLNDFKIGDSFDRGVITNISKECFHGSEPYYHGIGLEVTKDGKAEFRDVYYLARWKYDEVFGKEKTLTRRKFLIKYKDTKHAISYNKGWWYVFYEHELNGKKIYASTDDVEIVKELLQVDFLDTDLVEIEEETIVI